KMDRVGSRTLWQLKQATESACWASRPGVPGGSVMSVPSTEEPVATMSAWLVVARAWLLVFVGQLAKKAGVEKKPTRGTWSTSSVAWRSEKRSQKRVVASPGFGGRIVTGFQSVKSPGWIWAAPAVPAKAGQSDPSVPLRSSSDP